MSKPFISVVMPVYGVEQYLNRAAESILQHFHGNHTEFQIIYR